MPKTVLIVDDSASIRQLVSFTVKEAGYEVVAAENGREALEKASESRFDLIITDLNMPEIDGISLIQRLRSMPDFRFVPILMLTTEAQEAKKREGRKAGASGWIVKPFTPETILSAVKKFIT